MDRHHQRMEKARFLAFHTDILQSLHNKDDERLEPKVWKTIHRFLQQRERLMKSKHCARNMKSVHGEALRHCDDFEVGGNAATPQAVRNVGSVVGSGVKSSLLVNSPTFRGSVLFSQTAASQNTPGGGGAAAEHLSSNPDNNNNNFYIIARLLGRQHQIMESTCQQRAQPFQPLLATTLTRIGTLHRELHRLRQLRWAAHHQHVRDALSVAEDDRPPESSSSSAQQDEERCRVAVLESKIYLWSLLAHDLQEAILDDSSSTNSKKDGA